MKKKSFKFKVLTKEDLVEKNNYSATCSGSRSDCCTRVCTKKGIVATADQWGKYLEVNAGVIQY